MTSAVRLATLGNDYDGASMREVIRQIEFALNQLTLDGREVIRVVNAGPGLPTPQPVALPNGFTIVLSNDPAQPLGVASPGNKSSISRSDHAHPKPTAADIGAEAAGTSASAISALKAEDNPFPQYESGIQFPFSTTVVEEGDEMTVPEEYNLLITNRGLTLFGSLVIEGQVYSV